MQTSSTRILDPVTCALRCHWAEHHVGCYNRRLATASSLEITDDEDQENRFYEVVCIQSHCV